MTQTFQIEITSVPDREELVAEIWVNHEQLAELRRDAGQIRVQLYARSDGRPWDVSYSSLLGALSKAQNRL